MTEMNSNCCGQSISNEHWRLSNEISNVQAELVLTVETFIIFLINARNTSLGTHTHMVLKLVSKSD